MLYGGAAGGGKSSALLMAALRFVHVPGYSALILRKDFGRLNLAGGLIPRSKEWLNGKAHWNGDQHIWTFKTDGTRPATIQFGYLQKADDKYRYGSSEYQTILWDEGTEFPEDDYLFLFSRLRMTEDIRKHGVFYQMLMGSNPGGKGHEFVKERWVTAEAEADLKADALKGVYYKKDSKTGSVRAFVPAKIADNPAVDRKDYEQNLLHLPVVYRERMMRGDWTINPIGLVKPEWFRYYKFRSAGGVNSDMVELLLTKFDVEGNFLHTEEVITEFNIKQEVLRFMTVDTAGGVKDIKNAASNKKLSFNAIGTFDFKQFGLFSGSRALLVRNVRRGKGWVYPDIRRNTIEVYNQWLPSSIRVENSQMGMALVEDLRGKLPIRTINTEGKDKIVRASTMCQMFADGEIYFPVVDNGWRSALESEILSIQGNMDEETNDQWDMLAYACNITGGKSRKTVVMAHDPRDTFKPEKKTGWF